MSSYCYNQPTRTETSLSPTVVRSISVQTSTIILDSGSTTRTRISSTTSITSFVTRRSTFYSSSCTTYTRYTNNPYPYGSGARTRVPTGVIVYAVLLGLWALAFIGCIIYLCCFTRSRREKRRKGQGAFSQPIYQPQQQYTPVPQDPLYSRPDSHYPPTTISSYGAPPQNLDPNSQASYAGYQNFNASNAGNQGTNQWPAQNTPSAASFASGPGPGYIPPGGTNSIYGSPAAGTISYSTTPSPPPGPPGSDPHRLLYTQQNDRLSAAVSLVHPYQSGPQPPQEQGPGPTYPPNGPAFGQQPNQQTYLSQQYRGYAEPSYNTRT